jgi:hypothetical protein
MILHKAVVQAKTRCGMLTVLGLLAFINGHNALAADGATITFSLSFPNSDPESYSIIVDSSGHAKYESTARVSQASDDKETFDFEFELSSANRAKIFDLASQANNFSGPVDSGNKKLAFTGAKKLTYQDGSATHTAEYNYSSLLPVQQLTTIFQNISQTMEHSRHLKFFHRYQKLALDSELKLMESQAQSNSLGELLALEPQLKAIADDRSVMNVVRSRAQKLIDFAKTPPAAVSR